MRMSLPRAMLVMPTGRDEDSSIELCGAFPKQLSCDVAGSGAQ